MFVCNVLDVDFGHAKVKQSTVELHIFTCTKGCDVIKYQTKYGLHFYA